MFGKKKSIYDEIIEFVFIIAIITELTFKTDYQTLLTFSLLLFCLKFFNLSVAQQKRKK